MMSDTKKRRRSLPPSTGWVWLCCWASLASSGVASAQSPPGSGLTQAAFQTAAPSSFPSGVAQAGAPSPTHPQLSGPTPPAITPVLLPRVQDNVGWTNSPLQPMMGNAPPANAAAANAPPATPPPTARPGRTAPTHLRLAQLPGRGRTDVPPPSPETAAKVADLIEGIQDAEIPLVIDPRRSKLFRTRQPVARIAVIHPALLEIVQYSPTEFELVGVRPGETTLTIWFGEPGEQQEVLRYLVRVETDLTIDERRRFIYGELERRINELFPDSFVQLIPVGASLFVRGQAKDGEDAAAILGMLSGATVNQLGQEIGPGSYADVGTPERPFLGVEDLPATNIINMLEVPGEQQIMLKVRVAELSRSAARGAGADLTVRAGDFTWNSMLGVGGAFSAVLDTDNLNLAIQAISSNGYSKILAEPNLVTLNGRPAVFFAGGQFAVPTAVGVGGIGAVSTSFQSFGTSITFLPSMIDKDRIRLQVTPTVSAVNNSLTVGGIPGLNTRTASTTVDLREGQWMAIAGLLEDQQSGNKVRVPLIGDVPIIDAIFSRRSINRSESELVILVSPEFVHPLEAEEVPLVLPGMEVTEPGDLDFFIVGRHEGRPEAHHRSTVWFLQRDRIFQAALAAHHQAKQQAKYQRAEQYYIQGDHGFSH